MPYVSLDITDREKVMSVIKEQAPDAVIHCAAWTAVDAAEDEDYLNADCDLVILKTVYEDGEEILASIDDDEEFDKVSGYFLQRIQDVFENGIEDDEEDE